MNIIKKCLLFAAITFAAVCILPINADAAPSDFSFTSEVFPPKMAALGGEAEVRIQLKNSGATNITEISVYISYLGDSIYDSDCCGETWNGSLAPGASLTLNRDVVFEPNYLDKDLTIRIAINNDADPADDEAHNGPLKLLSESNVFKSNGGQEPQKDVYYVGETITVTDNMRNSLGIEAADLSIAYYFKRAGGTSTDTPIALGTVAAGATKEYSFDYTFTAGDIGSFRIGSEITYDVAGRGPYKEYNVAHDFVVEPEPTPEPAPEPTPTSTLAPTSDATPNLAPSESTDMTGGSYNSAGGESATTASASDQTAETPEPEAPASANWLKIVIAVLIVLLVAAVIVLVVVVAKKNKSKDIFS